MNLSHFDSIRWATITVAASLVMFVACGDSAKPVAVPQTTTTTAPAPTTTTKPVDFVATEATFVNLKKMTPVRFFFVANGLGNLDETLEVARSKDGGVYPVGSIVQLVPQEAMVKRAKGFNPAGNDWEFFFLDIDEKGTTIVTRGKNEVKNGFGLQCSACHEAAEPKWDLICEADHGCAPLPIGRDLIKVAQDADVRPSN